MKMEKAVKVSVPGKKIKLMVLLSFKLTIKFTLIGADLRIGGFWDLARGDRQKSHIACTCVCVLRMGESRMGGVR